MQVPPWGNPAERKSAPNLSPRSPKTPQVQLNEQSWVGRNLAAPPDLDKRNQRIKIYWLHSGPGLFSSRMMSISLFLSSNLFLFSSPGLFSSLLLSSSLSLFSILGLTICRMLFSPQVF